ncbi:MAG: MEKHLA domain-containing protein [Flavobacteriales bacterium]|nr:MEKHLA domain-containing protein [Flavobacteriales bacterium]|tara:strand:+ start:702 stop:1145 length:444 start_codon:yes stop_codon:yes gene_type:complete
MNKIEHIQNVLNSFEKLTGKALIYRKSPEEDFFQIENGKFVLVSHNGAEDPILNYGNQFALNLWEMNWSEFIKTPSRKTAESDLQSKRRKMLDTVLRQGYYDEYEGVRISSSGKRFKIKNAIIWNVNNEKGDYIGQAAYFNSLEYLT